MQRILSPRMPVMHRLPLILGLPTNSGLWVKACRRVSASAATSRMATRLGIDGVG